MCVVLNGWRVEACVGGGTGWLIGAEGTRWKSIGGAQQMAAHAKARAIEAQDRATSIVRAAEAVRNDRSRSSDSQGCGTITATRWIGARSEER